MHVVIDAQCFVINLRRYRDRPSKMCSQFDSLGISFERYAAIDGKRHPRLLHKVFAGNQYSYEKKREMTPGEMACVLSHMGVLRVIVRRRVRFAIIFEDDACIREGFYEIWDRHLRSLLERYDIVKLEGIMVRHTSSDGPGVWLTNDFRAITPLRPSLGSAAYAVSLAGAQRLLEKLKFQKSDPYDHLLAMYEKHRICYAEIRPFPVGQSKANKSTLNSDRALVDNQAITSRRKSAYDRLYWAYCRSIRLFMWLRELCRDGR